MDQVETSQDPMAEYYRLKKRNKRIAITWVVAPIATLALILVVYAIATFVITNMAGSGGSNPVLSTIMSIVRVVMGLLGIVAVVGMLVSVPMCVIYLAKRVPMPGAVFDERSGKGDQSEVPEEIKNWNWGAAGLTWIWGASHRVWLSFLTFIPLVGFIMRFVLGSKGNEWAWRAEKWESVEAFKKEQEKWRVVGIVFFIFSLLSVLGQLTNGGRY